MTTLIEVTRIQPGNNDRTRFDPKALRELAASIEKNGLIQPITVRPLCQDGEPIGLFQIVAGERRFRAVQLLGWSEVTALVADLSDEEAAAIMLSENTSRQDLDPIDEGRAYSARMNGFGWTVEDCALAGGVSCIRVLFRLKLLKLEGPIQQLIRTGDLPLGYAQILADADLDINRQRLALGRLRDHVHPTPPWFRRICGEYKSDQAQELLIPEDFSLASPAPAVHEPDCNDLPLPTTTAAPIAGGTLREMLEGQVAFWTEAADAWLQAGKPFKRQECEAAAAALRAAIPALLAM